MRETAQPGSGQPSRHQFTVMGTEKGRDGGIDLRGIVVDADIDQITLQPRSNQIGIDRQSLKRCGIGQIRLSITDALPSGPEIVQGW